MTSDLFTIQNKVPVELERAVNALRTLQSRLEVEA